MATVTDRGSDAEVVQALVVVRTRITVVTRQAVAHRVLAAGDGTKRVVFADTDDKFAVELAGDVIQMWQKIPVEE